MPGTTGTSTIGSPVVAIVAGGLTALLVATIGFIWRAEKQGQNWGLDPQAGSIGSTSGSPAETTQWPTAYPPTTSTTSCDTAVGYQQVVGADGRMSTVVPQSWWPESMSGPGSHEAREPGDAGLLVRYGGAAAVAEDVYQGIRTAAADFAATRPGYVEQRLERSTVNNAPGAYWEFQVDVDGTARHVGAYYWRIDGYEFFVYASGPEHRWSEAAQLLTVMVSCAKP